MLNIKGAIFDLDGTLLNSMIIWESVAADYLRSRGVTPRPKLNDDLHALGGHDIPAYFKAEYGLRESVNTIQRGMYRLLEEFYFFKALPKQGVFPVLDALSERGVKMCIATATDRMLVEPALERCGMLGYFGRIFTCGEEATRKSSPDIYLRAAAYLGTEIADTLVVEDAPYAMASAKSAGFIVAGVYDRSANGRQDDIIELCDYYFIKMDEMLDLII